MKKYCWVFTLNNYTEGEKPFVVQTSKEGWVTRHLQWKDAGYVYIGYGMEVSSTGTPHLQGVVVFKRAVGFKTLKSISPKAHWEPMRGKWTEALDYCQKDGKFVAYVGSLPSGKALKPEIDRRWRGDREVVKPVEGAPESDVYKAVGELRKEVQGLKESQKHIAEAVARMYAKQMDLIGLMVDIKKNNLL